MLVYILLYHSKLLVFLLNLLYLILLHMDKHLRLLLLQIQMNQVIAQGNLRLSVLLCRIVEFYCHRKACHISGAVCNRICHVVQSRCTADLILVRNPDAVGNRSVQAVLRGKSLCQVICIQAEPQWAIQGKDR